MKELIGKAASRVLNLSCLFEFLNLEEVLKGHGALEAVKSRGKGSVCLTTQLKPLTLM